MNKNYLKDIDLDYNNEIFIVLPAFNEESTVSEIITDLANRKYNVLVINDGSYDKTLELAQLTKEKFPNNVFIYSHIINRGLGAAIKTGFKAANLHNAKYVITFDADGQHDVDDLNNVIIPLINKEADVVIGSRIFEDMPLSRNFANTAMNLITHIFYGAKVKDSQSGLRAFNNKAISLIDINSKGYDVSSEIIREIKNKNLKLTEVPITTIYTQETKNKGTDIIVGLKIIIRMIINMFN